MKKNETDEVAQSASRNATPDTATEPAASPTQPSRAGGRGILIGAIAASLVGGLALGGAGGFALAAATGDRHPAIAEQGGMPGQQGGMPGGGPQGGQPNQGGPNQGPPNQGVPNPNGNQGQDGP